MQKLLVTLVILCFAGFAQAQYEEYESYQTFSDLDKYQRDYGLVIMPSGIFYTIEEDNSVNGSASVDRKREVLLYDARMYYIFRGGFSFGLLYGRESQVVNSNAPKSSRTNIGMTFGFIKHGWAALATYLPYSVQELTGTTDFSEYSKGSGVQLDFAYHFRLGRYFSIGPQLTYKNIQYKEAESAVTSTDSDASSNHSVLVPMISLMFNLYRG